MGAKRSLYQLESHCQAFPAREAHGWANRSKPALRQSAPRWRRNEPDPFAPVTQCAFT